jgi:hypothetical protein
MSTLPEYWELIIIMNGTARLVDLEYAKVMGDDVSHDVRTVDIPLSAQDDSHPCFTGQNTLYVN